MRARRRVRSLVRVALTGNIASGKSAVSGIWEEQGAAVIDADELARRAVEPGTRGLAQVLRRFGDSVRAPDGSLDRAALRAIVFADEASRRALEAIVHPEVELLRQQEERRIALTNGRIIVHSIPLLFETGLDDRFDVIVLVDAPEHVRLQRIVETRGVERSEAESMIAAQMPAAEKRRKSHHVIENEGTVDDLRARALEVWSEIQARTA
jgi:dephospho-CoA kinase